MAYHAYDPGLVRNHGVSLADRDNVFVLKRTSGLHKCGLIPCLIRKSGSNRHQYYKVT